MRTEFPLWPVLVIITIVTLQIYFPIVTQDFANWDDPKHIAAIWEPSWLRAYYVITDFDLSFTGVKYYSPLHFLSLMLDQALVGYSFAPQPWIAKLFNVFFHLANGLLVYALLKALSISRRGALVGALLFAVHPLMVGSVAWISERKLLLATLFYLTAFIAFVRITAEKWWKFPLVAILFLMSLLSKPSAVTFPFVASAYLWIFKRSKSDSHSYMFLTILCSIALFWSVYVISTEVSGPYILPQWYYRPFIAAAALLFYIGKIILPIGLVPIYPRWDVVGNPLFYGALLLLVLIIFGIALRYSHYLKGHYKFGLWFFWINLAPASGLVVFGYMSHSFVADHFVYLPMVGISICASALFDDLSVHADAAKRWAILNCATYGVIAVYAILAIKQTVIWGDPVALWEANLKLNKSAPAVYVNYGAILTEQNRLGEAAEMFKRALKLSPGVDAAYANLGLIRLRQGDLEAARILFESALGLNQSEPTYYARLAYVLKKLNRLDGSLDLLEIANERMPPSALILNELAKIKAEMGEKSIAEKMCRSAIRYDPFYLESYVNLSKLLAERHSFDEAILVLNTGLKYSSNPILQQELLDVLRLKTSR